MILKGDLGPSALNELDLSDSQPQLPVPGLVLITLPYISMSSIFNHIDVQRKIRA